LVEYSDQKKSRANERHFQNGRNRERMEAIFKMAADKIGKMSMFSDLNENLYLGLF
jgi:hypothetical protein